MPSWQLFLKTRELTQSMPCKQLGESTNNSKTSYTKQWTSVKNYRFNHVNIFPPNVDIAAAAPGEWRLHHGWALAQLGDLRGSVAAETLRAETHGAAHGEWFGDRWPWRFGMGKSHESHINSPLDIKLSDIGYIYIYHHISTKLSFLNSFNISKIFLFCTGPKVLTLTKALHARSGTLHQGPQHHLSLQGRMD